jgi:hypothetical protein
LVDNKYQTEQYGKDIKKWISTIDRQKYYEDRGYRTYRLNLIELSIDHRNIINAIRQQII